MCDIKQAASQASIVHQASILENVIKYRAEIEALHVLIDTSSLNNAETELLEDIWERATTDGEVVSITDVNIIKGMLEQCNRLVIQIAAASKSINDREFE